MFNLVMLKADSEREVPNGNLNSDKRSAYENAIKLCKDCFPTETEIEADNPDASMCYHIFTIKVNSDSEEFLEKRKDLFTEITNLVDWWCVDKDIKGNLNFSFGVQDMYEPQGK